MKKMKINHLTKLSWRNHRNGARRVANNSNDDISYESVWKTFEVILYLVTDWPLSSVIRYPNTTAVKFIIVTCIMDCCRYKKRQRCNTRNVKKIGIAVCLRATMSVYVGILHVNLQVSLRLTRAMSSNTRQMINDDKIAL